jgi:hypothetical protein
MERILVYLQGFENDEYKIGLQYSHVKNSIVVGGDECYRFDIQEFICKQFKKNTKFVGKLTANHTYKATIENFSLKDMERLTNLLIRVKHFGYDFKSVRSLGSTFGLFPRKKQVVYGRNDMERKRTGLSQFIQ